jgi:pilus assembly protein CpaB
MARSLPIPSVGESQNRLAFYGAIGLAAIAAIFAFAALRAAGGDGGSGSGAAANVDVVVAAQQIEAGTTIEEGMLRITSVPEDGLVDGARTDLEGLTGLVARHAITRGDQINDAKLGTREDVSGGPLGDVVPPGKRGVSVEVSEERIFGGLLAPGDHVDVIAVIQRTVEDNDIPTAIVLVQNAEVLSVADELLDPVTRRDVDGALIPTENSGGVISEEPDDVDAQPRARSVTIAVDPADALRVSLAQEEWSVWLALRGPGDEDAPDVPPQTLDFD